MLHRRVAEKSEPDFPVFKDYRADGMTDYIAIINRFAPDYTIGEMDCIYSSWLTSRPDGFTDAHVAAFKRVVPTLALAFKAAALARMTGTLMETYLGRDAGRRVLSGRIIRGVTERIDAAIWFSDLRGFTRITDLLAGADHPAVERLCRRRCFGDPRAGWGRAEADRRRHSCDLYG